MQISQNACASADRYREAKAKYFALKGASTEELGSARDAFLSAAQDLASTVLAEIDAGEAEGAS